MNRGRAQRWLNRIWRTSDLALTPYDPPPPPPPPPVAHKKPEPAPKETEAREAKLQRRLDACLSIPKAAGSADASSSSSSGSSSTSTSAPKKRPLVIDVQSREHTQGVAVVDHLYKLGRAPNPKQKKQENRVRTAELQLEVGRDGVNDKEYHRLERAQDFSVDQFRPVLIAEAVGLWQKAR